MHPSPSPSAGGPRFRLPLRITRQPFSPSNTRNSELVELLAEAKWRFIDITKVSVFWSRCAYGCQLGLNGAKHAELRS